MILEGWPTRTETKPPGSSVTTSPPPWFITWIAIVMSAWCRRACPPMPWVGPGSFGHPGSGGSVAFGDLDAGVGFGYVTNLWSFRIGEPRASDLAAAVVACLG